MIQSTILLAGLTEFPYLSKALMRHNASMQIWHVETCRNLEQACHSVKKAGENARLISFSTDVIVPAWVLESMSLPGYNFHPGPPAYPGSYPANFAIYDDVETFGVTAHELAPIVDSGPIVGVRSFPVPINGFAGDLQTLAYMELITLFLDLAPALATHLSRLPETGDTWQGPTRTRLDAQTLSQTDTLPTLSPVEIDRRHRAFSSLKDI